LDPAQPAGSCKAEKKQRDPSEIPACQQQGMSVGGQGNTRDGFPTQLLMISEKPKGIVCSEIPACLQQGMSVGGQENTHHRFSGAHPLAIFPKGSIADGRQRATEETARKRTFA
jgi:hypothetical protein